MFKKMFSIENINNSTSYMEKAMPLKDNTSNNDTQFQTDRKQFIETIPQMTHPENKWIGGTRDASDVARRRRVSASKSTINPYLTTMSFSNINDTNTRNSALNRVRSGGSVVPPKKNAY